MTLFKDYLSNFKDNDIYIEILDKDNNLVFSNLDFKDTKEREELKNPLVNKRKYVIRDIDKKTYLFVTSLIEVGG